MKSQDIVVLLKLISLHFILADSYKLDGVSLKFSHGFEDWVDDGAIENEFTGGRLNQPSLLTGYIEKQFSMRALEAGTGISKSQISLSLKRMFDVGLAKYDRKLGVPKTNTKSLLDFIAYGITYVFPAKLGELRRGIATSIAAPVLQGKLMSAGDLAPVWPHANGNTKGMATEPLHPNVFKAVRYDGLMYAFLALTDAVRIGNPRERNLALDMLQTLLKVSK
jgi:hypothetical protein